MEKFSKFYQQRRNALICLGIAMFILLVIFSYIFQWKWTGFNKKTLWDWLTLSGSLAIPIVAVWITSRLNQDREIAEQNERATSLQEYINKMSDLLLEKKLRKAKTDSEVSIIANALTKAVFFNLDGKQKGVVLHFIYISDLLNRKKAIIDLNGVSLRKANLTKMPLRNADLHGINLRKAEMNEVRLRDTDLTEADLSKASLIKAHLIKTNLTNAVFIKANLSGATLKGANLVGAEMRKANLRNANFRGAKLTGAIFTGANLKGATVTKIQLDSAKTLKGAIMPDGSKHP